MIVAILAAAAAALPPMLPESYTLLCQAEQSTGFDWVDGEWVKKNYKPEAYIVQVGGPNVCLSDKIGQKADLGSFMMRTVCGNIRVVGKPYNPPGSTECSEVYIAGRTDADRTLMCRSAELVFSGAIDGLFQHSHVTGNVLSKPENGYKDSLVLDVGKCSIIKS